MSHDDTIISVRLSVSLTYMTLYQKRYT